MNDLDCRESEMMEKTKRAITVMICIVGVIVTLVGCGSTTTETNDKAKMRTIVDACGREVKIPAQVKRVVPLANGLRYLCYAQAQDLVVGIEKGEKEHELVKAYNWVYYDTWKDKPIAGEGGSGGYKPYIEQIVEINPDVVICAYTKDAADDLQQKSGIPVVTIHSGTLFQENYEQSLRIVGEVCGKEKRCEEVIQYIRNVKEDLNRRTKDVKDEEKPSVYAGAVSFSGGHGIEGSMKNFPPLVAINAKSAILPNEGGKTQAVNLDPEEILNKNPDIIFLDPNNLSLVNKDYAKNPSFYKSLKAVQKDQVYTMLGYNWYHTNVEIAMADCYYAGSVVYPKQFADIPSEKKAAEIFQFMLGSDNYYEQLKEHGFGFGKIKIGE